MAAITLFNQVSIMSVEREGVVIMKCRLDSQLLLLI